MFVHADFDFTHLKALAREEGDLQFHAAVGCEIDQLSKHGATTGEFCVEATSVNGMHGSNADKRLLEAKFKFLGSQRTALNRKDRLLWQGIRCVVSSLDADGEDIGRDFLKLHFVPPTNSKASVSGNVFVPRAGNAVFALKSRTASYSCASSCSNENG